MTRIAFTFGAMSGLIIIISITGTLVISGVDPDPTLEWAGYLITLLAMSVIFIDIRGNFAEPQSVACQRLRALRSSCGQLTPRPL